MTSTRTVSDSVGPAIAFSDGVAMGTIDVLDSVDTLLRRQTSDRLTSANRCLRNWTGPHATSSVRIFNKMLTDAIDLHGELRQLMASIVNAAAAAADAQGTVLSRRIAVPHDVQWTTTGVSLPSGTTPGQCSAVPADLIDYATQTTGFDQELMRQAADVTTALATLRRATGTDLLPFIPDLGTELRDEAYRNLGDDQWVGRVGQAFFRVASLQARRGEDRPSTHDLLRSTVTASTTQLDSPDLDPPSPPPRPHAGDPPDQVLQWWMSLTPAEQQCLIEDEPEFVGSMDGIPCADRDKANRILLDQAQKKLDQQIADLQAQEPPYSPAPVSGTPNPDWAAWKTRMDALQDRKKALEGIQAAIAPGAQPPGYLVGFDPDHGNGHAIVAVGADPDQATNVVTNVQGYQAHLGAGNTDDIKAAQMLVTQAGKKGNHSTSAIVWLGYDAPQTLDQVGDMQYADKGAKDLALFLQGLRATHQGSSPAHVTLIGHSYGAVTVCNALVVAGAQSPPLADDVVLIGPTGAGRAKSASDLHATHVYLGVGSNDYYAAPGWPFEAGTNPYDLGAEQFDCGADPHTNYFANGDPTQADTDVGVQNMMRVILGDEPHVTPPPSPRSTPPHGY